MDGTPVTIPTWGPTNSPEAVLKEMFAEKFPNTEVKVDPGFLVWVGEAFLFAHQEDTTWFVYTANPNNQEVLLAKASWCNSLTGRKLISLVFFFAHIHTDWAISEDTPPPQPGEEVEKNLLLGPAPGVLDKWLFIEHEWKNVEGQIRREIHLHSRLAEEQRWDKDDHLSVVLSNPLPED